MQPRTPPRREAATKDRLFNPRPRQAHVLLRPAAFLKLMFCCHTASTEIGGFGISAANDPLVIEEFALMPQRTSIATVEFDDAAVADHADRYADQGIEPNRSLRVWIHTHPGESAMPSSTDEETFARSFGGCDWAAMLIQGRGEENYCRLRFNAGPAGEVVVPVIFDWASLPAWLGQNPDRIEHLVRGWVAELDHCVVAEPQHWTLRDLHELSPLDREGRFALDADEELFVRGDDDRFDLADDAEAWLALYEEEVARGER